MQPGWWFEEAVAGQTIAHPLARTIGSDEHVWLAWITANASDLHGNADRAVRGAFGQPVVLGALTAAIVIGLAMPAAAGAPAGVAGRSLWRSIRLGGPVLAGDTLRAESEVHATHAEGAGGYVERTIRGLSQRGELVVRVEETCFAFSRHATAPGAR